MSRRFIPLDQLDTLRLARQRDKQMRELDQIVRSNSTARLEAWLANQEATNARTN